MSQGYNNNSNRKAKTNNGSAYEEDYKDIRTPINFKKQKESKEKLPATVPEQLAKLKERGCIVEDEKAALKTLTDLNYFRLAHYFSLFLQDNGKYREGTSFNEVLRVYDFDRELRSLILQVLEEIEIALRAHCSNYHAIKYGATGYLNANSFSHVHKHQYFISRVNHLIDSNQDSEMVKHYMKKHNGQFPLWVIMELFSFGCLNMFYSDMKPGDKMDISKKFYGLSSGTLEIKLRMMSDFRNHCAHYHRLYDWEMGDLHSGEGSVFEYILIMKEIYRRPAKWKDGFLKQFNNMYSDYKDIVDLSMLGFPENWLDILSEDEFDESLAEKDETKENAVKNDTANS